MTIDCTGSTSGTGSTGSPSPIDHSDAASHGPLLTRDQWKALEAAETALRKFCHDVRHALNNHWSMTLELSGPYFVDGREHIEVGLTRNEAIGFLNSRRRQLEDSVAVLGGNPESIWHHGDWQPESNPGVAR